MLAAPARPHRFQLAEIPVRPGLAEIPVRRELGLATAYPTTTVARLTTTEI